MPAAFGNTGANPGLSRNCHRGADLHDVTARTGWKAGASVDPGARTPPGVTARRTTARRRHDTHARAARSPAPPTAPRPAPHLIAPRPRAGERDERTGDLGAPLRWPRWHGFVIPIRRPACYERLTDRREGTLDDHPPAPPRQRLGTPAPPAASMTSGIAGWPGSPGARVRLAIAAGLAALSTAAELVPFYAVYRAVAAVVVGARRAGRLGVGGRRGDPRPLRAVRPGPLRVAPGGLRPAAPAAHADGRAPGPGAAGLVLGPAQRGAQEGHGRRRRAARDVPGPRRARTWLRRHRGHGDDGVAAGPRLAHGAGGGGRRARPRSPAWPGRCAARTSGWSAPRVDGGDERGDRRARAGPAGGQGVQPGRSQRVADDRAGRCATTPAGSAS